MSGTRTNIVQHLRTTTANAAPAANSMLDGEIAIEQADPMKLWVGVPTSMDATGRKLLLDRGAIATAQVWHDGSLTGTGQQAVPLSVAQATQAQKGGGEIADTAEIDAVTPVDTRLVSPSGLRFVTGAQLATLVTTAKKIIPAINEIYSDIGQLIGLTIFAGSYNAATSTGTYNGQGGIAAGSGPLPPASTANHGSYLINTTDGAGNGANEPGQPMHPEDWLISDGTSWELLHFHQVTITAANVGITPIPGLGATNVQMALEEIWSVTNTALQDLFFTTPTFSGDALTAATPLEVNVLDAGAY